MKTLEYFAEKSFIDALKTFFDDLHIPLHHIGDEPVAITETLEAKYKPNDPAHQLIDEIYALGAVDDAAFTIEHEASASALSASAELAAVREKKTDYDGLLIFGVTLKAREKGLLPTRSQMAEITRAFNRAFNFTPVVVVFRYAGFIAFASCERSAYAQTWREGEKAGKVSLLRDIDVCKTHPGHMRILQQLQINPQKINSFQKLYNYWQGVLSVSTLNKDFYTALSNWFFAAREWVEFPDKSENAVERGLIRLITRLIFTWFIKERGLVPEQLFDARYLQGLLKDSKPESDTYYRAVLQNLFFATLNSEMNERRFCEDKGGPHGQKGDYAITCFRYAEEFKDPNAWLELVKDVPFLNGGLFECLDHCTKEGEYIDGFSRNPKRQARVPNRLLWGDPFRADLSEPLGDKKKKSVEVTPLLNLLHSYKFTVDENTPLEEDVALDPELLGKVFENLLASYNPETRTTARKQTGSFYTPREIVHYMVEEALYAYLQNATRERAHDDDQASQQNETRERAHEGRPPALAHASRSDDPLRILLSDADDRTAAELGFPDEQIAALVNAIQRCTILDPACGSGAFPMGALAKMVAILKKLDPENNLWRAAQLNAVAERLKQESNRSEATAQAQAQTQKIFEDNNPDYTRKLFLIEKCLFGVDIQPVALQITKLRFFIALIIDQNIDRAKDNWGIRALPNLETKFTAANTLISLPQTGSTLFDTTELQTHKAQLFDKRRQHIAPKNRREKKQLEEDDKKLRALIQNELLELRFDEDGARLIADYNPYDQNATAPFFDPEWMFGPDVKDGFDIVIGNPPYGVKFTPDEAKELKAAFPTVNVRPESYVAFIEKSVNLLRQSGNLAFIIPDTFLNLGFTSSLRKFLLRETYLTEIFLMPAATFEAATVDTALLFAKRHSSDKYNVNDVRVKAFGKKDSVTLLDQPPRSNFANTTDWYKEGVFNVVSNEADSLLVKRMDKAGCFLSDIADMFSGIKSYEVGKGTPPQTRAVADAKPFTSSTQKTKEFAPLRDGKHVGKYIDYWNQNNWINYGEWLAAPRKADNFKGEKILIRKIVGDTLIATYIPDTSYCNTLLFVLKLKPDACYDYKFILGILNSKLIAWYFRSKFQISVEDTFPQIMIRDILQFPIPTATPDEQAAIASKVEQILAAKAHDPAADVSTLEREIDELVADLYGLDDAEKQLVGLRAL